MSSLMKQVKQFVLPEERLKARAKDALDIADRIIVEMQAQQVNVKKCCSYQETMLDNLHKVMDGALKIGNKPLYLQTGKLAEVVGNWHGITKKMMNDETVMIEFVSTVKTFYTAVIDYKEIVKDFAKTTKDIGTLGRIGISVPKQIEGASAVAADSFRRLTDSLTSIKMSYTGLTDYVIIDDEDQLSKTFDEERGRLAGKKQNEQGSEK